jgi:hypothetical protein
VSFFRSGFIPALIFGFSAGEGDEGFVSGSCIREGGEVKSTSKSLVEFCASVDFRFGVVEAEPFFLWSFPCDDPLFTALVVNEAGLGEENEFACLVVEGDWVKKLDRSWRLDRGGSGEEYLCGVLESVHVLEIMLDADGLYGGIRPALCCDGGNVERTMLNQPQGCDDPSKIPGKTLVY